MTRDPYDWVMGTAASMDEYGRPVAAVPPGALMAQPQPVTGPPGQLAEQPSYDPFEAAAARVRFGAKPAGGRQAGAFTGVLDQLPEQVLSIPKKAFSVSEAWRQGERTPAMAGELFNTTLDVANVGTPFAQAGALGSAGGKAVMGELATQAPPFYSAVERAAQGLKQPSAPGQQWLGTLRNQPGVKPEELQHLGLEEFLTGQQGSVPKQALLDRIAANKLEVGEVWKGATPTFGGEEARRRLQTGEQVFAEGSEYPMHSNASILSTGRYTSASDPTKFQQYTLPGGENYREMLLTMPTKDGGKSARMTQIEQKLQNPGDYDTAELNALRQEYKQLAGTARNSGDFLSSHYDEPNILAHVRTNDRVIDGKKTLFVEEVQSDWHQAGKKKGYESDRKALLDEVVAKEKAAIVAHELKRENAPQLAAAYDEASARLDAFDQSGKAVPDAPFKSTWPELAMKRVIREAAEKGYDKVAWTPGSVQADRYDLSKQISDIRFEKSGSGGFDSLNTIDRQTRGVLTARDHNGKVVMEQFVEANELADHIGKEAAEKLLAQPPAHTSRAGLATSKRQLSGLDLKVGGEGMKGFYDEILPATVNKLIKKHGGRVQQADLPPRSGIDIDKPPRVHTIDITPQLREAAMKGFPLFAAGGVAATGVMGELARQDRAEQ